MKRGKLFAIIFVPLISVFVISCIVMFIHYLHMHDMRFYNESFNGVIQKIEKDERGLPTVFFNNDSFYFGFYYDREGGDLSLGDSVVKKKGEMNYNVFTKDSLGKWEIEYRSQTWPIRGF